MDTTTSDPEQDRLMELAGKSYEKLSQLWKIYGHGEESLGKRKNCVYKYTQELFVDMIAEEERRIEEKRGELVKLRMESELLASQLELPNQDLTDLSLLTEQAVLTGKLDEFKKLKAKKMEVWLGLRKTETLLCEELGEALSEEPVGIPKELEVSGLRALISTLEKEKKRRVDLYLGLKQSVAASLEQLEKIASSPIETKLLSPVTPILSLSFLREAQQVQTDLTCQINEIKCNVNSIWTKIRELWKRLDIEEVAQKMFEESHRDIKPSTLEMLRTELRNLEVLKMANLAKFIARLRGEIISLSNEVFKHPELPTETISEECLKEHEDIYRDLEQFSQDNNKIIELFKTRNDMWKEWKEYEARAEDPNRLNNRGGGLLREERTRRVLEKKLPKIEKEIEKLNNGFQVFGVDILDYMRNEWEERNRDKEDRKAEKKKKTAAGALSEKSVMNMTRKRPGTGTPAGTTPGKRNKLMPFNKVVATTPRTGRPGLRDRLVSPARTYSDFTNHQQIFQSTLNNGVNPSLQSTPAPTPQKVEPTPKKGYTPRQGPAAPTKKLFMTPTMHI